MPDIVAHAHTSTAMATFETEPQPLIPTLKRSYSSSDDDDDQLGLLGSSKRPKVSFDPEVEIRTSDQLSGKSLALVNVEIRHAIKQLVEGDSEEYNRIKDLFGAEQNDIEPALLRQYLLGLANNANILHRPCSELVHTVICHEWLGRDDTYVNIYFHFMRQLVSLQGGYTGEILKMLIQNFAHLSSSAGALPHHNLLKRLELQARVHSALKQLLTLKPAANSILADVLSAKFPFPTDSKKAHVEYVRNILKIIEYAPELRSNILDLITDRLVNIDVRVQVDVEELDYDVEDEFARSGYSQIDGRDAAYDDEDSDSESVMSDESVDPEEQRVKDLRSSVEKMDAVLDVVFAFLHPTFSKGSTCPETGIMFSQLLSQFRSIVLPTYRSRHTQFLLFHFAQTSPDLAIRFSDTCLTALKDKTLSPTLRTSAAAYLASFVARGAHLSHDDIDYIFKNLTAYLEKLRLEYEPSMQTSIRNSAPSLSRHGTYYATFQAAMYIFCFRWRNLLAEPDEHIEEDEADICDGKELNWAPGVSAIFESNVFCKLNPLKLCAPEIVEEFARITHHLRFMYVFPVIDRNRRLRLNQATVQSPGMAARGTSLSAMQGDRMHQLDAYFPFDPFRLPVSKRWLVGDYNEWKGIVGLHDTPMEDNEDNDVYLDEQGDIEEDEDLAQLEEGTETPVDSVQEDATILRRA